MVVDVGSNVEDLTVGDQVTTGVLQGCGGCSNCRLGRPNYCKSLGEVLFPGGFAQRTSVHHADYQYLVPCNGLDLLQATLHEPLSCSLRIVEQARVSPGQTVVVLGLGTMGVMSALLAKAFGAGSVVGVDTNPARVDAANALGIESVSPGGGPLAEPTRIEADVVVEATGSPVGFETALAIAGLGGRIVVGSVYSRLAAELDLRPIMRKELEIIGAKGSYPHVTRRGSSLSVDLLKRNDLPWRKIPRVYGIEEAEKAFQDMVSGKVIKPIIQMKSGAANYG